MGDPSGRYFITFNGEVYNFAELRTGLQKRGYEFRTRTDTEVLLAGYLEFGESILQELDGMFAFAVYDSRERCLTLVRDRAGEKPLYFAASKDRFLFASELKPLAKAPGASPRLDPYGVFSYAVLRYVPAPNTIFEGLESLEPGSILRVRADGRQFRRFYFAYDRVGSYESSDVAELAENVEDALTDAVNRRLVASDVPVGAFLSSGIDSSLVCALAAKRIGRPLQTFCAGFESDGVDETGGAMAIARELGLQHRTYTVSSSDLLSVAASLGECLDEPNGDRSCVPVFLLSRAMRREMTVALSGDGGDELFCGYGRYLQFKDVRRDYPADSGAQVLERYFDVALPVFGIGTAQQAFPEEYAQWRDDFLDRYALLYMRSGWTDAQRLSVLDFHTYLPGAVLAKMDKMSMRHALEVRSPFFSPEVMRLSAALNADQCSGRETLKPVLRTILARYLPPALISRQKIGFGMPASFMKTHSPFFLGLLDKAREVLAETNFFSSRRKAFLLLSANAPRNINSMWALVALGLWVDSLGLGV